MEYLVSFYLAFIGGYSLLKISSFISRILNRKKGDLKELFIEKTDTLIRGILTIGLTILVIVTR